LSLLISDAASTSLISSKDCT